MSPRKRTPDKETAEDTTAVAEPPAAESSADKTNFAERAGQKKWVPAPDPFGIAGDSGRRLRLFESRRDRQMALKFDDKPSQRVIDKLKDADYHWNPTDKISGTSSKEDTALTTRIDAERLYQEIRQMILQEKGIEAGPEITF